MLQYINPKIKWFYELRILFIIVYRLRLLVRKCNTMIFILLHCIYLTVLIEITSKKKRKKNNNTFFTKFFYAVYVRVYICRTDRAYKQECTSTSIQEHTKVMKRNEIECMGNVCACVLYVKAKRWIELNNYAM